MAREPAGRTRFVAGRRPPSTCFRTVALYQTVEDQRDRARPRWPSNDERPPPRRSRRKRGGLLKQEGPPSAKLSRPSLEQGSLTSSSRRSLRGKVLVQPSIASDMAVKHNLQKASVSERRAEELARRAVGEGSGTAQADVAATAERVSPQIKKRGRRRVRRDSAPPRSSRVSERCGRSHRRHECR